MRLLTRPNSDQASDSVPFDTCQPSTRLCSSLLGAAFLSVALLPASAGAQGLSTARFEELCRHRISAAWREVGQWLCPAYLRGLIDGARLQAAHTAGPGDDPRRLMQFCMSEAVTIDDALGAVIGYIDANPDSRQQPAAATVYVAFATRWPCTP